MRLSMGVQSQVVQSAHVIKNFPQYSSNVAMKVNAKLGGTTSRTISRTPDAQLRPGSVIIGADVSHASPVAGHRLWRQCLVLWTPGDRNTWEPVKPGGDALK